MDILFFESLPSTQLYLVEALNSGSIKAPIAILAFEQTNGVGSRENNWEGGKGNFFASFATPLALLPSDLPLASASIYFSFIMKKVLIEYNPAVWLKWPNDLYFDDTKIGGTITQKTGECLICGIGINLKSGTNPYNALKIATTPEEILRRFIEALLAFPSWKQVFSEYQIEFSFSQKFSVHIGKEKVSLKNVSLQNDGALVINGEKVYSLR